jgi:hypothetical protein
MKWTVARFPNGSWTTGGKPDDPAYAECEVFVVYAKDRDVAKRTAQSQRQRSIRRVAKR